jgi:hypothetical protein
VLRRLKPVRGPGTGSGTILELELLGSFRKLLLATEKLL